MSKKDIFIKLLKIYRSTIYFLLSLIGIMVLMMGIYTITVPEYKDLWGFTLSMDVFLLVELSIIATMYLARVYIDKNKPEVPKGEQFVESYVKCTCGNDRFELPENYYEKYKDNEEVEAEVIDHHIFRYECTKCHKMMKRVVDSE